MNTISVNTDTPCKNAATKFFNAKIVLYQCGSTDIIQSNAAREKVIARMKINIFEYSSLLLNNARMLPYPQGRSYLR